MKRLLLFVLMCWPFLFAGSICNVVVGSGAYVEEAAQSFTVGATAAGSLAGNSSTAQLTGVSAGDLIVVMVAWHNYTGTPTVSDGTSSLTAGTQSASTYEHVQFFYLTSSVASGTVTYTASLSGATYIQVIACRVTCGTTPSVDVQGASAGGTSTTAASSAVTSTEATTIAFGGFYNLGGASASSTTIAGASPDGTRNGASNVSQMAYKVESSTFSSGTATFNLNASSEWAAQIIVFK